jgi:hypothetical protein
MSGDNFVIKNTFIELKDQEGSDKTESPIRRAKTMSGSELWIHDTYTAPRTMTSLERVVRDRSILPTPPSSPEPVDDDPTVSDPAIVWIDERAFKEVANPMKLELSEFSNKVKCYKFTEKFIRAFDKKFACQPKEGKKGYPIVIICSPQNFNELMSYLGRVSSDILSVVRGIIVFKAESPPPTGAPNFPKQIIYANSWDLVLSAMKRLTYSISS